MKPRNVSVSDLSPEAQRQAAEQLRGQFKPQRGTGTPRPAKYGNRRTAYKSVLGFERVYDSIKEANFAADLDVAFKCGFILWWLPQVSIPLPGGVIYRADFLMMDKQKGPVWYDVKGCDTQASINKRKQVHALFGIEVELA